MLSAEQLAFRDSGIGGSDARTVMYGDTKAWMQLRAEKIDRVPPKFTKAQRRLMDLGQAVEPLCLRWFSEDYMPLRQHKSPLELCRSWSLEPLFRCILDGETLADGFPVQCKFHTGEQSTEELADQYLPQLQHEMMVTGSASLWFAVVFGRWGKFEAIEVRRDEEFMALYQMRALDFQHYWKTGKLPSNMTPPPRAVADIKKLRDHVWPSGDNIVMPLANEWLNAKHYSDELDGYARKLKALFPEDAKSAKWISTQGQGVLMKKNRAGVISLTAL